MFGEGVAELEDLAEAVDLALKVDFHALHSDERDGAVVEISRLEAKLAALRSGAVQAYDAHLDWGREGHRSAANGIRHRCRMYGGEAAGKVKLARAMVRMPVTAEALGRGDITEAHARRLIRAASRPEFPGAESMLIEKAMDRSYASWHRRVTYWEQQVDEARRDERDPEPPDDRESKREAHVSKTIFDLTRIDAWLDPIGGEAFREALRRIEQELFDDDWKLAKREHGDAVTIDKLWRTPSQRRADALVEMARRAMTAPTGGKRPLPLVIIHTDLDTFEQALARLIGAEPPTPLGTERLCETDDGTVISPTQMIEQALLGHVRRLVYESPGVILDYGRKQRLFKGELRQAMQARDRFCDHPGCEIPARHCEGDHLLEWNHGGHTKHSNGRCRCSYHHRNHRPRPG
ncbi:MAG: hypothetical protein DHS20C19_15210 [Acidimicrobiales bacterium]|nr:MAG: hypothetical protein DHS20C19_15210 [Acidimicrobiales bacterium]